MRQLSQMKKHTKETPALLHLLQQEKTSIIQNTFSRHIVIDEPGDVVHQIRLLAYLELYQEGKLELVDTSNPYGARRTYVEFRHVVVRPENLHDVQGYDA